MHAGAAFEELLDQRLKGPAPDVQSVCRGVPPGTAATYGFFFLESCSDMAATPITAPFAGAMAPARSATPLTSPTTPRERPVGDRRGPGVAHGVTCRPSSSRSGRRLSSRQQAAVDELMALGACISEDVSRRELRSTFRELARRYHPDRHTGAGGVDRARLARQFARLCDAYRVLAASI
jgi:hypothetical protein